MTIHEKEKTFITKVNSKKSRNYNEVSIFQSLKPNCPFLTFATGQFQHMVLVSNELFILNENLGHSRATKSYKKAIRSYQELQKSY